MEAISITSRLGLGGRRMPIGLVSVRIRIGGSRSAARSAERARRLAVGQCEKCHRPARIGRTRCVACAAKDTDRATKRFEALRVAALAAMYKEQGGRCAGCQMPLPARLMSIDHIIPRSAGGDDDPGNLQLLCHYCNSSKNNRSQSVLLAALRKRGIIDASGRNIEKRRRPKARAGARGRIGIKTRYADRRERGLCMRCDKRAIPGRAMCERHAEEARQYQRSLRDKLTLPKLGAEDAYEWRWQPTEAEAAAMEKRGLSFFAVRGGKVKRRNPVSPLSAFGEANGT